MTRWDLEIDSYYFEKSNNFWIFAPKANKNHRFLYKQAQTNVKQTKWKQIEFSETKKWKIWLLKKMSLEPNRDWKTWETTEVD